jgi:hypothetical protein
MKAVFGFLAGTVLLAMPFQLGAQDLTPAEVAQIESEVKEAAEAWIDVWRANDCALVTTVFHPEYFTQPRGGYLATSIDEAISQCESAIANRASFSGGWVETNVRVISRDAAVLMGVWEGEFHYRDDTAPRRYNHSAQVILFERTENGWGGTFYVNSNDPPKPVGGEG